MSENSNFLRIAELVLNVASISALDQSNGYDYACCGLSMFFLSSTFGTMAHSNRSWLSWYEETEYCSYLCALPLFAAQVCFDTKVLPFWLITGVSFLIPVKLLALRYLFVDDEDEDTSTNVVHFLSLTAMVYSGLVRNVEKAYLLPYTLAFSNYFLMPISSALYKFGLSLVCLHWLGYKESTQGILMERLVNVCNQIKDWF